VVDPADEASVQRELLLAALGDIGGAVGANDQKAAAALVVHGLLFAGVTSVVTKLGSIYVRAASTEQRVGMALLLVAFGVFLGSVAALLLAVSPYRPLAVHQDLEHEYQGVFFPDLAGLGGGPSPGTWGWFWPRMRVSVLPFFRTRRVFAGRPPGTGSPLVATMRLRVESMTVEDVNRELMVEVLKLKDILDWESACARIGYRLLALELGFVAALFVLVMFVAAGQVR
jgi:hypothetical protein